ncbi:MAG: endo alpha-1,4 polygalactosaminidase, partial [Elusimicrobia bacterium]|nr:endo alpha-1,4 polygalactosaminidase [Elusimicrobiota bacterium]
MRRLIPVLVGAVALFSSSVSAGDKLACYYGGGRLEDLARYDVVILQPGRYAAADVAKLKSLGHVTVLGYVSLGQDDQLRRGNGKGPGGWASWYVDEFQGSGLSRPGKDGAPDKDADWNAYYVNPADRHWRALVRDEVKDIKAMGMDGVFADTVLLPDDKFTASLEKKMKKGMTKLVRSLKGWSGGVVYLNNAYDSLPAWA